MIWEVLWNLAPYFLVLKSLWNVEPLWHGFTELSLQTPPAIKLIHFTHLHLSERDVGEKPLKIVILNCVFT